MKDSKSFNRTNVGLKRYYATRRRRLTYTFNRTNVGLKQYENDFWGDLRYAFNRTNVGLKHKFLCEEVGVGSLLIEPMWD